MKTDLKDISDTRKTLVVTLGADEISQEHQAIGAEFAKQARVPGFRPGKAPINLILKRFEKQIAEELRGKIMSRAYRDGLKESKAEVLQLVDVSELTLETGKDAEISFTIDIRPAFELPTYKGLAAKVPSTEVKDEEIDQMIEHIRRDRADFQPVDRASQDGDYVKFSLEGAVDGTPIIEMAPDRPIFGKMPQTWEEVGSGDSLIPGLAKQLGGLAKGDKKEVEIDFPGDFTLEALRGKKAVYQIEALEVRERELPALDEAFFKSQQVESLEDLKARISESLKMRKESQNRSEIRRQVSEALAANVEFGIPESLIEAETQNILRQVVEQNVQRGVPQEELEKNKDDLFANSRKAAIGRAKLQLILARVAEAENIKAEERDLQQVIMQEAMRSKMKPEKYAKELSRDRGRIDSIQQAVVFDKTLDFLVDQATVTTES
ncbi:MAG: trigger factor [Opitutaceae bacterium]